MRGPVFHAFDRIRAALDNATVKEIKARIDEQHKNGEKFIRYLNAVKGLTRKSKRVVMNMRLFSDLSKGKPVFTNLRPLSQIKLRLLLIEAADDAEFMVRENHHISFSVDRESLSVAKGKTVLLDYDLLDQAVGNILDNAAKYSWPNTRVEIAASMTKKKRFCITIKNIGMKLLPNEVSRVKTRLERGRNVELYTSEGSGIGLWIVDHIMFAHGGDLEIVPTNKDNETEMKLIFPVKD